MKTTIEAATACPNNNVWCAGEHDQAGEFCVLSNARVNGIVASVWAGEATSHGQVELDIAVWCDEWDGDGSVKADSFEGAIAGVQRMIKDLQLTIKELQRIKAKVQ